MKAIRALFCLIVALHPTWLLAEDDIIFSDSPSSSFYDPSWGFINGPSLLERVGDKCPVDTEIFYQGQNSLRLSWTSISGGDWGLAVAAPGWPGHDINLQETLSFWVLAAAPIASIDLPLLYLEDLSNKKTAKVQMSAYSGDISEAEWVNMEIPLQVFKENPGEANLMRIKTVFFGQDNDDEVAHTLYLDEIRLISGENFDATAPGIPQNLNSTGYERHVVIDWEPVSDEDVFGYNIFRAGRRSPYEKIGSTTADLTVFADYHGELNKRYNYEVTAFDRVYNESKPSKQIGGTTTASLDDEALLDMVQEMTFRFFWDYAHPLSAMTRERYPGSSNLITSGGSGMGLMTIPVAIERGFITRAQGAARVLRMLQFLRDAERFHGAWSHWLDGTTGAALPFSPLDDGGDIVETAYVAQGLLTIRQYFDPKDPNEEPLVTLATELWEGIEWDWYRRPETPNVITWHWSPNYEWQMNLPVRGFNEAMIVYLLAIASPTHPVPASLYEEGWAGAADYDNGKSFYGIPQFVGKDRGGPLFFTHYSFMGFDPRGIRDSHANYFENNRNTSLINRAWCIENPEGFVGYGEACWGLTASDDPQHGYFAHEPAPGLDNGTITPTAALSAFPYTPEESMQALKHFYREHGVFLVGALGFKDAFNLSLDWVAESFLAIDQGPIILMIENHRSALLWDLFMANPEIEPMLASIGFVAE